MSALNATNTQDRGRKWIAVATNYLLKAHNQLRSNQNSICCEMRSGRMTTLTTNGNINFVGTSHYPPLSKAYFTHI